MRQGGCVVCVCVLAVRLGGKAKVTAQSNSFERSSSFVISSLQPCQEERIAPPAPPPAPLPPRLVSVMSSRCCLPSVWWPQLALSSTPRCVCLDVPGHMSSWQLLSDIIIIPTFMIYFRIILPSAIGPQFMHTLLSLPHPQDHLPHYH